MKLLTFFVLVSIVTATASSYSQQTKFNLQLKGVTINQVFQEIEANSEFILLYNEKQLDTNRKVDINADNETVEKILNQVFKNTKNTYKIYDRQIVILETEKRESPSTVNSETIADQKKVVSGRVTDSKGISLPGVSVVLKGTTTGVTTNNDGNFSISLSGDAKVLVFSFVGMMSQEIALGSKTLIKVVMEEETIGLEEIVAIGYGTMKRSDLTGSVGSINSDIISNRPVMSIDQSLEGRVAGVSVSQLNHEPGETTAIRIRGGNSLSASNSPLWVVDGYPVGNLNMFDPNDIESMEILKDASATAIYGSRGANGVILVTTKRGKKGKPIIEYNTSVGVSNAVHLPELADADLYLQIYQEAIKNPPTIQEPWRSANTNWLKLGYGKTGITQNYQLSVRGGNEKTQYAIGGSYMDQTGTTPNIGFNRSTFNLKLDSEISSKIKIGSSSILSRTLNYGNNMDNHIVEMLPTMLNKDENGNYVTLAAYPYQFAEAPDKTNYLQKVEDQVNNTTRFRVLSNMYINWEIISGLVFKTSWGIDYYNSTGENYSPTYTQGTQISQGSISMQESMDWLNENTLTFDKNINENNVLNAMIGFTQQTNMSKARTMNGQKFLNDALGIEGIGGTGVQSITSNRQRWDLLSGIARVNYRLMQKYLFTAAIRADGCSKFGANNKWGYFPSGAFAWRAGEEDFVKNLNVFSNLKVRASYGLTGNQAISPYQSLAKISTAKTFLNAAEVIAAYPSSPPYKDLRWEKTAQTDIGVDMAFFNSKLDLTADYYIKRTSDLLIDVPLPLTAGGQSTITRNLGNLKNNGFEFGANTHLDISKLKWDIGVVFSTNKNIVINLEGRTDYWVQSVSQMGDFLKIEEGQPVGNIWGYQTDGIYQKGDDLSIEGSAPGNIKYVDQNNDKKITADDRVILGNALPDFIAGLNMDFYYGNFSLNMAFNSSMGNDLVNVNWAKWETPNPSANFLAVAGRERWTEDNPSNTYPKSAPGYNQGQKITDRIMENASFLRLQNLRLEYRFPTKNISWVQKATLYLNGENLFCLTNYRGYDPEVSTTGSDVLSLGGDFGAYPATRTFTLGLNVKF